MPRGDGHDPLFEAVGERVCQARKAAGLSQGTLAMQVRVSRTSIVNIELGRQRAPLSLLWTIATELKVDLASLIPRHHELAQRGEPVQLDAETVHTIEAAANHDPATKRLLADFVQRARTRIDGQEPKRAADARPERRRTTP